MSLSADFSAYGRNRIRVQIGDNNGLGIFSDKARGECFANTAGATRYNTDFASDLHT
jgi:hypothetical protein